MEYKDKIDVHGEAVAATRRIYENNPTHLQQAANRGNSAQPPVHHNEEADNETFERLWIGAGRLFLEQSECKYPHEMIQTVRLRATGKRSNVIRCRNRFQSFCLLF